MSDFLFSSARARAGELGSALREYLGGVTAETLELHGDWGSVACARRAAEPTPALERDGYLSVLIGDPIVRLGSGPPALARNPERRSAVHALLRAGAGGWDMLDGPFAAIGAGAEGGIVVTDLASFIPLFQATGRAGDLVVGSHPDAVARAAGRSNELDRVSAADLAIHLTSTFPFTLFVGVEQAMPAASRRFAADGCWIEASTPYWRPLERTRYPSLGAAAEALRGALVENVETACSGLEEVGLLFSGGEDARAVLGAVPAGVRARAFVFADWENREVRVARHAAAAYGAELVSGTRAEGHYLAGLEQVSAMVGANQSFVDVHAYGFHERLGIRHLPLVLGGLSSDSWLKAEHAGSPAAPPASIIRPELLAAVAERRAGFRAWLATMRPETATEWERLWPFSMRRHAGNLHGNRRLFASHEPFHGSSVVRLAAEVPQGWKRRRALFHRAMKPLLARSWHVPHSRYRYPYFGWLANLPLSLGLGAARGMRAIARGETRARQGPWPKWNRLATSPAADEIRSLRPLLRSPLAGIFVDAPPEEIERSIRREWSSLRRLFLLQLVYLAGKSAGEPTEPDT